MRVRRAIVKLTKWGGLAVALLWAVMWAASWQREGFVLIGQHLSAATRSGWLQLSYCPSDVPAIRWYSFGSSSELLMGSWVLDVYELPRSTVVMIHARVPLLMALAASAAAWWLDLRGARRRRPGHCPNCNYSRAGIAPDVVCPECGAGAVGAGEMGEGSGGQRAT